MRRFSQRSALVTLNEINITPLLDLAFVLLIIFVITTPLLEQSISLSLPTGGKPQPALKKEDKRLIEISREGELRMNGRVLRLRDIETELVRARDANPNLVVGIRGDRRTQFDHVAQIWDMCERVGISGVAVSTHPSPSSGGR